jgi:hypothetical protein
LYSALPALVEGLHCLGEHELLASLVAVCERALAAGVLMSANSVQAAAGTAAAAAQDWARAEHHFTEALSFAERAPHIPAQADVRLRHASALVTRGLKEDRERARRMLEEARLLFDGAHRPRRVRECDELLAQIPRE